jgi:hypothetical protein
MTQKEYSVEVLEAQYNEITTLYDYAEELVATVESEFVADPAAQLEIVEPLIAEIGDATDVLTEEFVLIAESRHHKHQSKASKKRIEGALRKIYVAVADYHKQVKDISKKAHGAIQNIADPIVAKIQRQIEKVVVIFLEFIQISLANLMSKAEVEALKARDARIALMMHQHAMTQQQ